MLLAAAYIVLSMWQRPALARISGVLEKSNSLATKGKVIAMFELVQYPAGKHELGQETYVGRCDRRMDVRSGTERFRLDMRVAPAFWGQKVVLRCYMLSERYEKPFLADVRGLCTHDSEELVLTLKPEIKGIKLRVSDSHPLPGG